MANIKKKGHSKCIHCYQWQPIENFPMRSGEGVKRRRTCRECFRAYCRNRYRDARLKGGLPYQRRGTKVGAAEFELVEAAIALAGFSYYYFFKGME